MTLRKIPLLLALQFIMSHNCFAVSEADKAIAADEIRRAMSTVEIKKEPVKASIRFDITGELWLDLPKDERLEYVTSSMRELAQKGMELPRSRGEYYALLIEKLSGQSDLRSATITQILSRILAEK